MFPKLRLTPRLLKLAYRFVDLETSGGVAVPDGRVFEYAFVISRLSQLQPGRLLDVGCVSRMNVVPVTLASMGWEVYGLDSRDWVPTLEKCGGVNFNFVLGDIRRTGFPNGFFDAVCAVSSLEHVGVDGRYGIKERDEEGDFRAMEEIGRILKDNGLLLATLPYGDSYSESVLNRVYDWERINRLCNGWRIEGRAIYKHYGIVVLSLRKEANDERSGEQEAAREAYTPVIS